MYRFDFVKAMFQGICLSVLAVCLLAGCGGGETGYHVSGEVTFDGKPIPAGRILFTPDGSQENEGGPGYAAIKDGKFDTKLPGGKMHAGGPMIVQITGMEPTGEAVPDPENPESETVNFQSLFPVYQTTAVLPEEETTKSFDVPAEVANRVIIDEEGAGSRGGP